MPKSIKYLIILQVLLLGVVAADFAHAHLYREHISAKVISKSNHWLGSLGNYHQLELEDGTFLTVRDFGVGLKIVEGNNCKLSLSRDRTVVDANCEIAQSPN